MALFLGAGTDLSWVYPEGERYDSFRKFVNANLLNWDNLLTELTQNSCINNKENRSTTVNHMASLKPLRN